MLWTEIITLADNRESVFGEAKQKNIYRRIERDPVHIALTKKLDKSKKHNILPTKFVFAIKHSDGGDIFRARFVIEGHRDRKQSSLFIIHIIQKVVKLLLALATILGLDE